jgi:hypothetical protein
MERLQEPRAEDALRLLRAVGVSDVVARSEEALPLQARFTEERIYAVPAGEAAAPVPPGTAAPTLWSADGITLDLGEARPVERIGFEVGEADWIARPRVAVSIDKRTWTAVEATASLADATLSSMKDPRHGLGEVRFAPQTARYFRLDRRLPARPGPLQAR